MTEGGVLAIAGAKGGVGKTTVALNLGVALARAGERVIVVELDLAMANLVDFLEIDPSTTIHDVLSGQGSISDAIVSSELGADLLPAGTDLEGFDAVNVAAIAPIVRGLKENYDFVLIDTAAGVSPETIYPLRLADQVIVVSTPRVASIRDTKKTMALADRVSGEVAGVIFNRSGTGNAPPPERLAAFLETDLLGSIPEDPAVPEAQDLSEPVVTHAPDSEAAEAIASIADKFVLDRGGAAAGAMGAGGVADYTRAEEIVEAAEAADPGDEVLAIDEEPSEGGFEFVNDE